MDLSDMFDSLQKEDKKPDEKVKAISIFDIVNSIYYNNNFIFSLETKKSYNKYMINKALSMGQDTIHFCNEMNILYDLDDDMHHTYLNGVVRKRKRWNNWFKTEKQEIVNIVKFFLTCNTSRAREVVGRLSEEEIEELRVSYEKLKIK